MKYREGTIPKTIRDLRSSLIDTLMRAPDRFFPDSYDFDGAYYMLEQGVENIRERLGQKKSDQMLDMIRQAKKHHEANDKLGSRLLQDVEMVLRDRQPYAYPRELYRWPVSPWLPELSEADLLRKNEDEE